MRKKIIIMMMKMMTMMMIQEMGAKDHDACSGFFLYSLIVQRYGKKGKQWKTLSGSLFSLLWLAYSLILLCLLSITHVI